MSKSNADAIIVNFNSTGFAIHCIDSIQRNIKNFPIAIKVIDNHSTDMPDKIIHRCPGVKLVKNLKNIGFGKAINFVLKTSTAKYILLINPDCVIRNCSFDTIFHYMDKHPDVAVAGPMILDHDGTLQGSARRFPTIWTSIFGRKSPLTKLFPNNPITKREFFCFNGGNHKLQSVDWVSGACMIIRSDAIKRVGGFDEHFFMYWEDADLCKRIKETGHKIIYFPKAQVYHHIGKSSNTRPLMSTYHFHKSCYYYFTKHTRLPFKLLKPLALMGLSIRCLFVIALNRFQWILNNSKSNSIKTRSKIVFRDGYETSVENILKNKIPNKRIKVSIITVVKNCESTINATVRSVSQQSYPEIEHIIVDGASTDNTLYILKKIRNCFDILISEPDKGIYDAMNKGIDIASGDIIGFLNADDVFADPEIIADVVKRANETGKDAVFGDLVYVHPQNPRRIVRFYDSSGFTRKWLTMGAMPAHPTLYLKREIYERYGRYKTDYRIAADFEFIARIFGEEQTSYCYLPKVMVRMSTGGISTKNLISNWVLNKEMMRACRENNIQTNILKILLKYPKKVAGIVKARKISLLPQ